MADETPKTAKTNLVFDASGMAKGAEEAKQAADKVVAANKAVEASATKAADTVTSATAKQTAAQRAAAKAAQDAATLQAAAAAAGGDAVEKAARRATSLASGQTRFLDSLSKSLDPLGAASTRASKQLETLLDIVARGGPNAERAGTMIVATTNKILEAQANQTAGTKASAAELDRLQDKYDPVGASARAMGVEVGELGKLLSAGRLDAVQHANAMIDLEEKYDEGAQAAKRLVAAQRELIESSRAANAAAQASATGQTMYNQFAGIKESPGTVGGRAVSSINSAQISAAVFEEYQQLKEKFDAAGVAADHMAAEVADLNRAQELGITINGGYDETLTKIKLKYNETAQAAERAIATQRDFIEQARAAQNAQNAQAAFNQQLGIPTSGTVGGRTISPIKSAQDSASVFMEAEAAAVNKTKEAWAEYNAILQAEVEGAKKAAAEHERLRQAFDQDGIAADRLKAKLADLDKARAGGVNITGGYDQARQDIMNKYDPATAKQVADTKALEEENKRLAQTFPTLKTAYDDHIKRLVDINKAEQANIINSQYADAARQRSAQSYEALKKGVDPVTGALRGYAVSQGQADFATRQMGVQTIQFFTSIQAGQGVMTAFIQQGHQIIDVMVATGTTLAGLGRQVGSIFTSIGGWIMRNPIVTAAAAAVAALTTLAIMAETTDRRMGRLRTELSGVRDDFAAVSKMVEDAAHHLAATTSLGTTESRTAGQTIVSQQEFQGTQQQLEALLITADKLAVLLKTDLPGGADFFAKALKDPTSAVEELRGKVKGFDTELINQVKALQDSGDKAGAFQRVLDAVRAATTDVTREVTPMMQAFSELATALTSAASGGRSLADSLGGYVTGSLTEIARVITKIVELLTWIDTHTPEWLKNPTQSLGAGALHDFLQSHGLTLDAKPGTGDLTVDRSGLGASSGATRDLSAPVRAGTAEMIQEAAALTGVSPALLQRVYNAEHAFNPDGSYKTSSAGAVGAMQVMPGTFTEMQQKYGADIRGPISDERSNIIAGAYYLRDQIRDRGDIGLGLANYNAGAGRVNQALKPGGSLPNETQEYVRSILAGYQPGGAMTVAAATGSNAPTTTSGGAANNTLVSDAVKAAGGLGIETLTRKDALDNILKFSSALEKLRVDGKEGTQDFITLNRALQLSQLTFQNAETPADELTKTLDRQAAGNGRLADAYTKGDQVIAFTIAQNKALEEVRKLAAEGTQVNVELVDQLTQKYLEEGNAIQRVELAKYTKDIDIQIDSEKRLLDIYVQGPAAVMRMKAALESEAKVRELVRAGLVDEATARQIVTAKNTEFAQLKAQEQLAPHIGANERQVLLYNKEAAAVGMDYDAHVKYSAMLQAEKQLMDAGLPTIGKFADAYKESAEKVAAAAENARYVKTSYDEVGNSLAQSFETIGDGITQVILEGKEGMLQFRNVSVSVAQQILKEFFKLAVLNPLLNSIFPGSQKRPTLGSTFDALQGGSSANDNQSGTGGVGSIAKAAPGFLERGYNWLFNIKGAQGTTGDSVDTVMSRLRGGTDIRGGADVAPITEALKDGSQSITDAVVDAGPKLGDAVADAGPALSDAVKSAAPEFGSILKSLFGGSSTTEGGQSPAGQIIGKVLGSVGSLFGGGAYVPTDTAASIAESAANATTATGLGGFLGGFKAHSGGLVGSDVGVPLDLLLPVAANLNNLPRFHEGMGGDEFAAILQKGERVLTEGQQDKVAAAANSNSADGGHGSVTMNFNFPNNTQPDQFRRAAQQVAGRVEGALARANKRNNNA